MIADAVSIPVIASGGGGRPEHIYEVLTEGHADAALIASILHYGEYSIRQIKEYLRCSRNKGQTLKVRQHERTTERHYCERISPPCGFTYLRLQAQKRNGNPEYILHQ